MFLALKEMKKEKGRFILVIGIVTLISYLVFFLSGLAYGLAKDNTSAVEAWQASNIILKAGTNSNIMSSMMDKDVLKQFNKKDVSPINIGRAVAYKNGKKTDKTTIDLVVIGLNSDSKAYPKVIEGSNPKNDDEALASLTLKQEYGLNIGDKLVMSMNDKSFKITGFTNEEKYNVSSVIYTNLHAASAAMMTFKDEGKATGGKTENKDNIEKSNAENKLINKGVVYRNKNSEEDAVSSATKKAPERIAGIIVHGSLPNIKDKKGFDIIPINKFINKLPGYFAQVLTFGLMIGFLILISSIVLGVFMFILTMQKKQTFGIMKVQGISNSYIAKSVIMQTGIVSFLGLISGFILTVISEYFLPYSVPFRSNYLFYLIIAALILITSLLGALFSVKAVTKVDPLEVLD